MIMFSFLKCLFLISVCTAGDIARNGPNSLELDLIDVEKNQTVIKEKGDTVEIQVYYESQCGACKDFHTGSLNDTMETIGSYIDLKVFPYGNAETTKNEDGKTVVTCQHGVDECHGNMLHACAIDILKNATLSEFYNSCMMLGDSTDDDATECGESMHIDSKPITDCAKSQRGKDLLEYHGEETDKVTNKKYVPWVLVNGKYFDTGDDLTKAVCDALTNPPPQCNQ